MLPLARRGAVGLGNHAPRQKLGQHLGVETIALAGALGDDPQLLGMRQDQALGQGLQELPEPFVAGGGLDDRLERSRAPAKNLRMHFGAVASQILACHDPNMLVDDTQCDNLFVEVNADVQHGVLLLWKQRRLTTTFGLPRLKADTSRLDLSFS